MRMYMKSEQTITRSTYYKTFAGLLVLLGATIGVAYINLGNFNVYIALTIALVKALLVVTYFMHLKISSKLTWMFAGAGVFWLLIMVTFTLADFSARY